MMMIMIMVIMMIIIINFIYFNRKFPSNVQLTAFGMYRMTIGAPKHKLGLAAGCFINQLCDFEIHPTIYKELV